MAVIMDSLGPSVKDTNSFPNRGRENSYIGFAASTVAYSLWRSMPR